VCRALALFEPVLDDPDRDLGAVMEAELFADVVDVTFGGTFADDQLFGDLAVGQAARDEQRDFAFP
jgi:hypothetical protein